MRAEEEENDRGIEELSGRVAALRGITVGIHSEAEAHNRLLDGIVRPLPSPPRPDPRPPPPSTQLPARTPTGAWEAPALTGPRCGWGGRTRRWTRGAGHCRRRSAVSRRRWRILRTGGSSGGLSGAPSPWSCSSRFCTKGPGRNHPQQGGDASPLRCPRREAAQRGLRTHKRPVDNLFTCTHFNILHNQIHAAEGVPHCSGLCHRFTPWARRRAWMASVRGRAAATKRRPCGAATVCTLPAGIPSFSRKASRPGRR